MTGKGSLQNKTLFDGVGTGSSTPGARHVLSNPSGYVPFDAFTPLKRCKEMASVDLYDSGITKVRWLSGRGPEQNAGTVQRTATTGSTVKTPSTNMLNNEQPRPKTATRRNADTVLPPPVRR